MLRHAELNDRDVWRLIRANQIQIAGNKRLKIYGRLDCTSGRRMTRDNRVFFASADLAEAEGYRPCGHCMKTAYRQWHARNG